MHSFGEMIHHYKNNHVSLEGREPYNKVERDVFPKLEEVVMVEVNNTVGVLEFLFVGRLDMI